MQAPGWCATEFHPFHTRRPPPDPDKSISVTAICFNLVVDARTTLQHHLSNLAVQQSLFSLCTLSRLSVTSLMMHELIKAYTFVVVLVPVCSAPYLQRELRYTTTKFDHDPFRLQYSRLYEFLFMLLVQTTILQFTYPWCSTQQHLFMSHQIAVRVCGYSTTICFRDIISQTVSTINLSSKHYSVANH